MLSCRRNVANPSRKLVFDQGADSTSRLPRLCDAIPQHVFELRVLRSGSAVSTSRRARASKCFLATSSMLLSDSSDTELLFSCQDPATAYVQTSSSSASTDAPNADSHSVQLRVRIQHQIDDREDHLVQERFRLPKQSSVGDRPPNDLSQNIASPLVRGQHPVAKSETSPPVRGRR